MNKMFSQKKAPSKKSKSKTSVPSPAPVPDVVSPSREKIAGLHPDRYYKAKDALSSMQRTRDYMKDKQLMNDVRAVAKHEMDGLSEFVGKKR